MKDDEKITGNLTIESENGRYDINVSRIGLMKAGVYSTFGGLIMGTSVYAFYRLVRWIFDLTTSKFKKPLTVACDAIPQADVIDIPKKRGRAKKQAL